MIVRVWRTRFLSERLADLEQFAKDVSAAMFHQLAGCLGYFHAVTEIQWITVTFWSDNEAIALAESSQIYLDTVERILGTGVLTGEQTTERYDVIGNRVVVPMRRGGVWRMGL